MSEALATRLTTAALVVLGVCTLVFLLLHLVPGDPVKAMLGGPDPRSAPRCPQ